MMTDEICPTCDGCGKITWHPQLLTENGFEPQPAVDLNCHSCGGAGTVTPQQQREIERLNDAWCKCEDPDARYFRNPDGYHGWTCIRCEKLVQIG